jgi:pyruvate carboxylase subunit A
MVFRVLIATGGEVAVRIAKTLQEAGMVPLGVYVSDDREALHRRYVYDDVEVRSYEDVEEIIRAAESLGADAVHPGYGLLVDEAKLAEQVARKGLVYIGPAPSNLSIARDKPALKTVVEKLGLKTLPWGLVESPEDVEEFGEEHGYPVILKPASGRWGIGVRVVRSREEVKEAFKASKSAAEKVFKDPRVYVEPFIEDARHIEVQVLGDLEKVLHLYERECVVSKVFKRVLCESPSPSLTPEARKSLLDQATALMQSMRFKSAGVVEFLYTSSGDLYFVEVNPGLTPEHSITESSLSLDLVKRQVEVALYGIVGLRQDDVGIKAHAVGANIYAENPETGERSTGRVQHYAEPSGFGVRVDSELYTGVQVALRDLVLKVVATGSDRSTALSRLRRAMSEVVVSGVSTNVEVVRALLESQLVESASYTIGAMSRLYDELAKKAENRSLLHAIVVSTLVEIGDEFAKKLTKKLKTIASVLQSEKVSRLKRSAWYYYVALRNMVHRPHVRRRREEGGGRERR